MFTAQYGLYIYIQFRSILTQTKLLFCHIVQDKATVRVNMLCGVVGTKDHFHVSLEDEVVRGSIVVQNGQQLWPPPPPPTPAPGATTVATPKSAAEKPVPAEPNYFANTLKDAAMYTGGNKPCLSSV